MLDDLSAHLLGRLRTGDEDAAEEMFERYVNRLVGLARSRMSEKLSRKTDAEDVVQSVFRSFFTRAREGQYELRRSGDLWRLLAAITVNKVLKKAEFHGAAKRRMASEESISPQDTTSSAATFEGIAAEPSPADAAVLAEEMELVMRELHENHRRMFEQRLQGESIAEIANNLEVSERQVRRALQKVKERLEQRLVESSRDPQQPADK